MKSAGEGPRSSVPLEVRAQLRGRIALPYLSLALDGLLAAAVAARDDLPPIDVEETAIEIPVAREPGGRFHLSTIAQGQREAHELKWILRKFPTQETQLMAEPGLRRLNFALGRQKNFRIPLETIHIDPEGLVWWCLGDDEQIRDLLSIVTHLGRRRAVGLGPVDQWTVTSCDPWPGFPVVREGRALRPLPIDWPGLVAPEPTMLPLTYPYWRFSDRVTVAEPVRLR